MARRDALAALAGAAVTTCAAAAASAARGQRDAAADGLHARAATRGRRFGSCVAWSAAGADRGSFANPAYAALLTRDCGLLVAENEMKWQALRPDPTRFAFDRFDAIMAYATAHGLAMRGHNLLWHQDRRMPAWLAGHDFGAHPAIAAAALLTDHIATVCTRYGTRIYSYDVVNEAVKPADGTLYETTLSRALGGALPTLDLAFRTARRVAPHAQLVYNDYMDWDAGSARHRAGVLSLLAGFRARGVPVDALGVQSHLSTGGAGATAAQREPEWRRFLDSVTAMGYDLVVTELDVRDTHLPADIAIRDRGVADDTRAYLDIMLGYPSLRDVLVWGMSDRYSWIEGLAPRPDGARRRPCPYDDRFVAKPMRAAIAAALTAAPVHA